MSHPVLFVPFYASGNGSLSIISQLWHCICCVPIIGYPGISTCSLQYINFHCWVSRCHNLHGVSITWVMNISSFSLAYFRILSEIILMFWPQTIIFGDFILCCIFQFMFILPLLSLFLTLIDIWYYNTWDYFRIIAWPVMSITLIMPVLCML